MLQLCEQYAKEYDVIFNADKSKCIISCPCFVASGSNLAHEVCFSLSGNVIENVETWPHLRHIDIAFLGRLFPSRRKIAFWGHLFPSVSDGKYH